MKVDGSLISLIQGVSQQPARDRLPGQGTLQENMTSDPVEGLGRRPPTEYVGDLYVNDPLVTRWEDFIAQDGNKYLVGYGNSKLRIWNLSASEKAVTINHPLAYLTGNRISLETIDNRTFVCDRTKITAMLSDVPLYSQGGGLIWLLGGQYGRTYRVTLNFVDGVGTPQTVSVTYASPNGGAAADSLLVATEALATQLHTALTGNATFNASFGATRVSDVIYIRWTDPNRIDDFDLTVDDGDGGANIFCMTRTTPTVARLPRYAPHRYVIKITGSGESSEDDWYAQFLVADDVSGTTLGLGFGKDGIWRECTAPFEAHKWDLTTMPHGLVQDPGTGNFTWAQAAWVERRAGDDTSNPPPSFLGRTLNDISSFQGRMALASGPAIIMSRIDTALDMWYQSATVEADDDPIDIQSTAKSFSVMREMIPQNRDLVAFSEKAQFIVFGRSSLSPRNAALVLSTSFEADLRATPAPTGRNIFFAISYGDYTGVKEFFAEGVDDVNDSRPITQHVANYIVGAVRQMASTSNFDNLVVLAESDYKKVFLYEFLWVDDTKAQSSWSTLIFKDEVVYTTFDQNFMYLVCRTASYPTGERYYLLKMNLGPQPDAGAGYVVYLDNKFTRSAVTTTFTAPYDIIARDMVVVQGAGCPNPGMTAEVTWNSSTNTATLTRNMNGGTVIVGERFLSRYRPTMPMVKDRDNVKVGTGRLTLKDFLVQVRATGYMEALVVSRYRPDRRTVFSGRIVNDPDNLVGSPAIVSLPVHVRVGDDADLCELELRSDKHLPLNLSDIEWRGQYTKRGKRMLGGGG